MRERPTPSYLPSRTHGTAASAFNNSLQDLLMVVYLSNLTRTQLAITDHLSLQMAASAVEA